MPVLCEFCKTGMRLTKLCPFSNEGCDKVINAIANTCSVVVWG